VVEPSGFRSGREFAAKPQPPDGSKTAQTREWSESAATRCSKLPRCSREFPNQPRVQQAGRGTRPLVCARSLIWPERLLGLVPVNGGQFAARPAAPRFLGTQFNLAVQSSRRTIGVPGNNIAPLLGPLLGMAHSRPAGYFHSGGQRKSFSDVTASSVRRTFIRSGSTLPNHFRVWRSA
jgi:hypothetical protein